MEYNFGGTRSLSLFMFIKRLENLGWRESFLTVSTFYRSRYVFSRGVFVGGHWDYWYCEIAKIKKGGKVRFYRWR